MCVLSACQSQDHDNSLLQVVVISGLRGAASRKTDHGEKHPMSPTVTLLQRYTITGSVCASSLRVSHLSDSMGVTTQSNCDASCARFFVSRLYL